jgi:hypothetical protein
MANTPKVPITGIDPVSKKTRIAILGAGPSGLFVLKRLVESARSDFEVTIFEKTSQPGAGMPYSSQGANEEHITNISGNEIPELVCSMKEWIRTASHEVLKPFGMVPEKFNEYKVVPRLLFGCYLTDQFNRLLKLARKARLSTTLYLETLVTDLVDDRDTNSVTVVSDKGSFVFEHVIITTGHCWPVTHEGKIPGYFDSPYPPSRLKLKVNHPVAIKGASLTAIDAVRTLARENGSFTTSGDGVLTYQLTAGSEGFRLVLHSISGLLPGIRFHQDDDLSMLKRSPLTHAEIHACRDLNNGFVPLDFLFDKNFKDAIREQDPGFYETIKELTIEGFVEQVMGLRERLDPFILFRAEYMEAEKSIRRRQSIYWKEALAELSFALNYPAKYLSAEDMLRLKKVLMPLISIVIAFVPQSSARELLALYEAGVLTLVAVDSDSEVVPLSEGGVVYKHRDSGGEPVSIRYKMFINCTGQPHFMFEEFPFKSLFHSGSISPALLQFKSAEEGQKLVPENKQVELHDNGEYYLRVPGLKINDNFQVLDKYGAYCDRIFVMAVPHIGGFNPDYSGLDFCESASERVVSHLSTLSGLK